MPTPAENAKTVAANLLAELKFPAPMLDHHKAALVNKLCDAPPPREKLAFQQKDKESAVKAVLGEPLETDDRSIFCIVHGGFVLRPGMDAEHASSFELLRKRQQRLINYLNNPINKDFADAFLKEPGMAEMFRRDPEDGNKIKGTAYFYKICYNNDSNMWLLCHACNMEKSAKDFKDWAIAQKRLGPDFVAALEARGVLQEGLLFDKVAVKNDAMDTALDMGGETVRVSSDPGQGLGEFIRDWYMAQHAREFASHREFYAENYDLFKRELEKVRQLAEAGLYEKADHAYNRLHNWCKRQLRASLAYREREAEYTDSSGEEGTDVLQQHAAAAVTKLGRETAAVPHYLKSLHQTISRVMGGDVVADAILAGQDFDGLSSAAIRGLTAEVERFCLGGRAAGVPPGAVSDFLRTQIASLRGPTMDEHARVLEENARLQAQMAEMQAELDILRAKAERTACAADVEAVRPDPVATLDAHKQRSAAAAVAATAGMGAGGGFTADHVSPKAKKHAETAKEASKRRGYRADSDSEDEGLAADELEGAKGRDVAKRTRIDPGLTAGGD